MQFFGRFFIVGYLLVLALYIALILLPSISLRRFSRALATNVAQMVVQAQPKVAQKVVAQKVLLGKGRKQLKACAANDIVPHILK